MDWSEQVSYGHQSEGFDYSELIGEVRWQAQQADLHLFPQQDASVPQIPNLWQAQQADPFLIPEQIDPVPQDIQLQQAQQADQLLIPEQVDSMPQRYYNDELDFEVSTTADISQQLPIQPQLEPPVALARPGRSKYNRPRKSTKPQRPNKKKNALGFFRNGHREYLKIFMETNRIKGHPIIQEILFSKKNYATRKDFEKIYRLRQLTACWHSMFISGYLYDHIEDGRALQEQRTEYSSTVESLKKAFLTKSMEGIRI